MRTLAISGLVALLTACGGGGGGSGSSAPTTATGYLKDSNTQGVRYVSGAQSGVTGADGSFTYEIGKSVAFSIGGVSLGSAAGHSVVTPVDLVASGATSSQAVQNLVRFLMMLDTDANPANGIQISPAVQAAAASWSAVNFDQTEANFTTAVSPIVTAANTADGIGTHALPTAAAAKTHVESTLRCARSGGFKGTFSGGDSGAFGIRIDAATGMATGVGYSQNLKSVFVITGTTAMSLDQNATFTSGVASTGATYSGKMTSPDAISGSWTNAPINGTYAGSRVGGALNAKYRFTGQFQSGVAVPLSFGLYTFDIDGSNKVNGLAYEVSSDLTVTLTGTVSGSTLSGTTSSGASFNATIDLAAGTVTGGTWTGGGSSGGFTASGCQLN